MKQLQLDDVYRRYLIDRGAVVLDQDGNEVFIGLTAEESAEYVLMMDAVDFAGRIKDGVDPLRLMALYDRHLGARPNLPPFFGNVSPSDWQPRRK